MELFLAKKHPMYILSIAQLLDLSKCETKAYGLNTALFKGLLLWNKLSNDLKDTKSLLPIKNKIYVLYEIMYCCICS